MNRIFCLGEEKTAARYEYRARILTWPGRKRLSNRFFIKALIKLTEQQSFQRGLLRFGQRCEKFVVFTPPHFSRLAKSQNTGAQTIPFKDEGL